MRRLVATLDADVDVNVNEVISTLVAKQTKRPITADELVEAMRRPFPTMAPDWLSAHLG